MLAAQATEPGLGHTTHYTLHPNLAEERNFHTICTGGGVQFSEEWNGQHPTLLGHGVTDLTVRKTNC